MWIEGAKALNVLQNPRQILSFLLTIGKHNQSCICEISPRSHDLEPSLSPLSLSLSLYTSVFQSLITNPSFHLPHPTFDGVLLHLTPHISKPSFEILSGLFRLTDVFTALDVTQSLFKPKTHSQIEL